MKKLLFIGSLLLILSACESDQDNSFAPVSIPTEQDSIHNYKGNFIMAGNSAVLKGNQFIYQVKMDSTAVGIRDSIKALKLENGSVIPMEVQGKVTKNPMSVGYSQLIEIKKIIEISIAKKSDTTEEEN